MARILIPAEESQGLELPQRRLVEGFCEGYELEEGRMCKDLAGATPEVDILVEQLDFSCRGTFVEAVVRRLINQCVLLKLEQQNLNR